jgi:site-specific DNA-methyltransferase (adenine-specific)
MSNPKMFRCSWVWEKEQGVNFLMARKQPMKVHEDVLVFSNAQPIYKPVMTHGKPYISGKGTSGDVTGNVIKKQTANLGSRYPRTVIKIKRETGLHPTQKPVSLFEYLIKTYTNEGDTVLDNCAGSGTSGVACINTNRKYILIEKEEKYFEICKQRVNDAVESITKI